MIRRLLIVLCLFALAASVTAQEDDPNQPPDPVATEEPAAEEAIPQGESAPEDTADTVTGDETQAGPDEAQAGPPEAATIDLLVGIVVPARLDLELLATATLGAERPEGWNGVSDPTNPDLALLVRSDLEYLASLVLGPDGRPEAWFGVVPSSNFAIARDIRHDLELLAETADVTRPASWSGGDPLFRCDRATQALVRLAEARLGFVIAADVNAPDFCTQTAEQASVFVETTLDAGDNTAQATGDPRITGDQALGYLDLAGTIRAGVIPVGERLEVVATGGNLILVRGIGFELFVDIGQTNLTAESVAGLPNAGGIRVAPRCDADWCD